VVQARGVAPRIVDCVSLSVRLVTDGYHPLSLSTWVACNGDDEHCNEDPPQKGSEDAL